MWRVAEPNEALIISGIRDHGNPKSPEEGLGFRIVTGRGTMIKPGVEAVRRLSLDLRETDLAIDCVTHQGIPLGIKGVVIFKVGDDFTSIANAARRFLDQQDQMDARVHNVFARHLRAIVGNAAEVAAQARIAQAHADRDATEQEQRAGGFNAAPRRNSSIKKSGYLAEVDAAAARALQSGPLADATARQEVVVQETRVAELEAHREEQRLQATIRKPADAKAYEQVTLSKAGRDARIAQAEAAKLEVELQAQADVERERLAAGAEAEQVRMRAGAQAESVRAVGDAEAAAIEAKGRAEGESVRARGMAEAETIKARADALAENQDAVIGQQLAENWPAIVEAAAKPFGAVDQLIVLNGAQGLAEVLATAMSQGISGLQLAREVLAGGTKRQENGRQNGNGKPVYPQATAKWASTPS
jgi:flotillin